MSNEKIEKICQRIAGYAVKLLKEGDYHAGYEIDVVIDGTLVTIPSPESYLDDLLHEEDPFYLRYPDYRQTDDGDFDEDEYNDLDDEERREFDADWRNNVDVKTLREARESDAAVLAGWFEEVIDKREYDLFIVPKYDEEEIEDLTNWTRGITTRSFLKRNAIEDATNATNHRIGLCFLRNNPKYV